ncbi:barstar family protein [Actinoplanes sp. GCM10030250]|uniref:barstar family protein n=1 Tax=Actinoplanes sp. GCM10030250 TaxID=3273376 RepID=UPI00360FD352
MRVVIDGRCVLDEAELHRRLAGALGYGPGYQPGLDALHERLVAGDPRPVELTCINASALRMALGIARFERFVALLESVEAMDAGKDWSERFVIRLID